MQLLEIIYQVNEGIYQSNQVNEGIKLMKRHSFLKEVLI